MLPQFKNPPVSEVVIGVFFETPLAALRPHHVGEWIAKYLPDYDRVQEQPEVFLPNTQPAFTFFQETPFPRYMLSSHSSATKIQLQKNAFFVNWQKSDWDEYPGFDSLTEEFHQKYALFKSFIAEKFELFELTPFFGDVTYQSVIALPTEGDPIRGVRTFIPDFNPLLEDEDQNRPSLLQFLVSQPVAEHNTLSTQLRSGQRADDPYVHVLILDLRMQGPFSTPGEEGIDEWLQYAHLKLNDKFLRLSDSKTQTEVWGRVT